MNREAFPPVEASPEKRIAERIIRRVKEIRRELKEMGIKTKSDLFRWWWDKWAPEVITPTGLWVTDQPEKVFSEFAKRKTAYHLTSAQAALNLLSDKIDILPARCLYGDIDNPKRNKMLMLLLPTGMTLWVVDEILEELLGETALANKQLVVWLGSEVDPEGVSVIRHVTDSKNEEPAWLLQTLCMYPVEQFMLSEEREFFRQQLLHLLFASHGIRDGWWQQAREKLTSPGDDESFFWEGLREKVIRVMSRVLTGRQELVLPSIRVSGAAILEVQVKALFDRFGACYPVGIPIGRHPARILPAPRIPPESVTTIYIDPEGFKKLEKLVAKNKLSINILPLDEFPQSKFLGRRTPPPFEEIQLDNPACSLRYPKNPNETNARWQKAISKGQIVPLDPFADTKLLSELLGLPLPASLEAVFSEGII